MLTIEEKECILSGFPNVKLSYENIIYKKVSNADYVVAIPRGNKCFAYFTYYKNNPVCFIMELDSFSKKRIIEIKLFNVCFSSDLAYGTIFYGTLFYNSGNRFFTIEDIFTYKGVNLDKSTWEQKLCLLSKILKKEIKQISYNNSYIVFGLPILCSTLEELDKKIANIKTNYLVDYIQFYSYHHINSFLSITYSDYNKNEVDLCKQEPCIESKINTPVKSNIESKEKTKNMRQNLKKEYIFLVRADIQDDIYHLYSINDDFEEIKCGTAHIPDFETSVMMNKIFRIIKENNNLDALEESDDEEEFENDQIDKYVKLDICVKMACVYNHKFKRWMPLRIVPDNYVAISTKELNNINKNYEQNKKKY
jgi:hypothetical protein